jgi:hypothetical protein
VPLVHEIEQTWEGEGGIARRIVEVLELLPGPVPESEFSLAAYGLGEVDVPGNIPAWFYVQLIAVALVVIGMIVWKVVKRLRATVSGN